MKRFAYVAVLIGIAFVATGCGKSLSQRVGEYAAEKAVENAYDGKVKVDYDNGGVTVKTEDGSYSTSGSIPKDWPADVKIYPGATVSYSGAGTGDQGMAVLATTTDSTEQVGNFYKEQFSGWEKAIDANYGGAVTLQFKKDGRSVAITAVGSDGQTTVTVSVTKE